MGCGSEDMNIRRLLEAQVDTHYAVSAVTAITNAAAPSIIPVTAIPAVDAASELIPERDCHLWQVQLHVDTRVNATQIEWSVCMAAATPLYRISPVITTGIDLDVALGAVGDVNAILGGGGIPYRRFTGIGLAGSLYVTARTNLGNCNVTARLIFVAKTPLPII